MKRLIVRVSIVLSVLIVCLLFLLAQAAPPLLPFAATPSLAALDSTGIDLLVRAPDMSYSQLRFGVGGMHALLSSAESLMKIISGGVPFSMATPPGPANVGLASQVIALADFTGDHSPGVAYIDLGGNRSAVSVYLGTPSFLYRGSANYTAGAGATQVLAADFNHDGKPDLAVTFDGDNSPAGVAILLNKGDGTFAPATTYAAGIAPTSAAALDINHDGVLDLAVTDAAASPGKVYVFLGKGDGSFASATSYTTDANPQAVTIADFNGDGNPDLAVCTSNNTVSILRGNGSGGFGTAQSYATGKNPLYIAAGDLNRDGKLDLVTANAGDQTVGVLLGKGDGSFNAGPAYATGLHPTSLVLTDYNGDGTLDVVQGLGDARGIGPGYDSFEINILIGNGDGTLQGSPVFTGGGTNLSSLVTADFDGDGKLDAVVNDQSQGALYLFSGAGNGKFQNATQIATLTGNGQQPAPYAAAAGDFNGDGKPDLAVTDSTNGNIVVLLNSASGLHISATYPSGGAAAAGIIAADLNGDGKLDLAVANPQNTTTGTGTSNIAVFFGAGDGTFQLNQSYPAGSQLGAITAADFNGDGKPDLAVTDAGATGSAGSVYVFLNNGSGGFQPSTSYTAGVSPTVVAAGDLNGDGRPDLAVSTHDANYSFSLQVLLNKGNGAFQPASQVSSDSGPGALAIADFNGDGKSDIVVSASGDSDMMWLAGNGDGTFMPEVRFATGFTPMTASAADLNGDGKPDLLVGNNSGTITPLLNKGANAAATVSWATGALLVAPDSIASIYGAHLATGTGSAASPADSLNGTTVTITDSNGASQPASLYYASAAQLNIVVPPGLASGTATVSVHSGDGLTSKGNVTVAPVAPGILTVGSNLLNAYVVHYDSSGNAGPLIQTVHLDGSGNLAATPISVDPPTDSVYLLLYGTGFRGAPSGQVSVAVGGLNLAPAYSGAQGQYAGMDQINLVLPHSLKGAGAVTVSLKAAGQQSNNSQLTIQ